MPFVRARPRNNIPYEKLMIEPHQVKAFYGVESTDEILDSDLQSTETSSQDKRESATNYDFHVTDNELWRTMPNSDQNETSSQDKRESATNYDFHVTDNELWRTMPNSCQATPTIGVYDKTTPNYLEDKAEPTNYNFHVTDDPLWRTMQNTTSGHNSGASTPNYVEERRESATNYNFHVTDNSLWRTRRDESQLVDPNTPNYLEDRRESETNYNFHVTDNSMWRTRVAESRMDGQATPNYAEERRESETNYNFHVSDNELWRTLVTAGQTTPVSESQIDDELTPTHETIRHERSHTELSPIREATIEQSQPTEGEQTRTNSQKSQRTQDELQTTSSQLSNISKEKNNETSLSPQTSTRRTTMAEKSFHFMVPTHSSFVKSKDSQSISNCQRSAERSFEKKSQIPKIVRQSVEAFTQTSANNNANRRRTVLQSMHEKSPGLPRRSIFLPPSDFNNFQFQRRVTLAPFFNRLSSGSEKSSSERVSVGSSTSFSDLPKESPPKSKIPQRSPRCLPSQKRTPTASPRLLDRVLVKEAFKSVNGTPLSSRLPISISPKTPSIRSVNSTKKSISSNSIRSVNSTKDNDEESEQHEESFNFTKESSDDQENEQNELTTSDGGLDASNESEESDTVDERPQIVQLSKALQQIGIDYKTPDHSQKSISKQASNKGKIVDSSIMTSTPTRNNFFTSLFGTREAKSGVIPVQHPTLNPSARPTTLFELGDSLDASVADDDGPFSQKIASQPPPAVRKPFSMLNDDDFGSPAPRPSTKSSSNGKKLIPNDSRFHGSNDTTINFALDDTPGVSFISGNSDRDSDLDSPAPKHIILRAKPKKNSPYMFVRPPKIVHGSEHLHEEQTAARRSKRTRFHRQLVCGEKPIYERDENGDYNIVGVSKGYTADPLCKKFNTFDKDVAMERQKKEAQRKKRIRQQNRAQHEELNKKYLD